MLDSWFFIIAFDLGSERGKRVERQTDAEKETDTERERERDRQTDRETETDRDRQTDRKKDRERQRPRDRDRERHTLRASLSGSFLQRRKDVVNQCLAFERDREKQRQRNRGDGRKGGGGGGGCVMLDPNEPRENRRDYNAGNRKSERKWCAVHGHSAIVAWLEPTARSGRVGQRRRGRGNEGKKLGENGNTEGEDGKRYDLQHSLCFLHRPRLALN